MSEAARNAKMVWDGNDAQAVRPNTWLQRLLCRLFGHVDDRPKGRDYFYSSRYPDEPCGRCGVLAIRGRIHCPFD